MADIVEEHVHTDGGGGGAMGVLAVVLILIVLLLVLYFTGVFGRMFGSKQIDVNIKENPGIVLLLS
jgi:hypothetical protein